MSINEGISKFGNWMDEADEPPRKREHNEYLCFFPPEVIVKYIEDYVTTDYTTSPSGEWININSEFTSDDKHRMGFNLEENYVNDFKLNTGMSLVRFVAEHEDIDVFQARLLLDEIALKMGKGVRRVKKSEHEKKRIEASDCSAILDLPDMKSFFDPRSGIGERALSYLKSRGIGEKHIRKYQLSYSDTKRCPKCHGDGYDDDDDQCSFCNGTGINFFYSRVIIPSYEKGNLIYLQGRTIFDGGSELRYQNIKAPRLQVVYFYDLLNEGDDIYICEGPVDAMTLFDYSTTALLNTKISDPQVTKILRKKPRRIIFVPDYDETVAKRERIKGAIAENMRKIMEQSNHEVDLGIYDWPRMLEDSGREIKKDINAAHITYVDEEYIKIYDEFQLKAAEADVKRKSVYDIDEE